MGTRRTSTNRATETNHVSVGVGDGSLPFAILLVPRAVHFDPCLSPVRSHAVGFVTVDVESTLTQRFFSHSLDQVDGEVTIPVSEGIGLIVERSVETRTLEPCGRGATSATLKIGSNPVTSHPPVISCN